MKIMVVGKGGREHALAWKFSQSGDVESILCVPGNAGTLATPKCQNFIAEDQDSHVKAALSHEIDLAVIGPEVPLVQGLADDLRAAGIPTLGPGAEAALLEGSKVLAKEFMERHNIRTAAYRRFQQDEYDQAVDYLQSAEYPLVVKADGLAAGKGVSICSAPDEAVKVLHGLFREESLGESGHSVLIEQFLQGKEASVLVLCDGKTALPLMSAMDHKRIGDHDTGANTGGMGVVAPNPFFTPEYQKDFQEAILDPTLKGLQEDEYDFRGIIFFGLMLQGGKNYLLEYNVRFGDPETQAILPMLKDDLAHLLLEVAEGRLRKRELNYNGGAACNVVLSSGGYPSSYETGFPISIENGTGLKANSVSAKGAALPVFMAGVRQENDGLYTDGGRVLSVTGIGSDYKGAREQVYSALPKIVYEGRYYRGDIGEGL